METNSVSKVNKQSSLQGTGNRRSYCYHYATHRSIICYNPDTRRKYPNEQQSITHKNMESSDLNCFVFAYGSNMCLERMVDRIRSAVSIGMGALHSHRLVFHKRGVDGSAKANAIHTGNRDDTIWGVLFQIDSDHKPTLDEFESVGIGYQTAVTNIRMSDGSHVHAWTYFALSTAIEDGLKPFTWYKDFVLRGARQHGLPSHYRKYLDSIDAIADPDISRSRTNKDILQKLRSKSESTP